MLLYESPGSPYAQKIKIALREKAIDFAVELPESLGTGRTDGKFGVGNPRCAIFIVMGKTDADAPRHAQQSMVLAPRDAPGVTVLRALNVFGYDDAPHGHMDVVLENVRAPVENILLGEGRGFEIAQGRLGPGRSHHCMRSIGAAERALEMMVDRLQERVAFGRPLAEQSVWHERIAESRCMIDQARLLTLNAAHKMDTVGNKAARAEIAMIKVVAPNMSSARITATVSDNVMASSWSWVTKIDVMPTRSISLRSSICIVRRSLASSALKGSSSSNTEGSSTSARAIATRCCWPPESWAG